MYKCNGHWLPLTSRNYPILFLTMEEGTQYMEFWKQNHDYSFQCFVAAYNCEN